MCCMNKLKLSCPFLIIHIYGIIRSIVSMVLTVSKKLEYNCNEDLEINTRIN